MTPLMPVYQHLLTSYKAWLHTLGYNAQSVKTLPRMAAKFLYHLSALGIRLEAVQTEDIATFRDQMAKRTTGSGMPLTTSTVNSYIQALRSFGRYLHETAQGQLEVSLPLQKPRYAEREPWSEGQISTLYKAIPEGVMGLRDRVLLNLYYGCGLRSSEGLQLEVKDVLYPQELLHIRKGKGYKERYVPFTPVQSADIQLYLNYCRPLLVRSAEETHLLLNTKGYPMKDSTLNRLIRAIRERIEDPVLQTKTLSPHVLRHSIATHLMERGMEIEDIGRLLGHTHLQSTQGYTHLVRKK